MFFCCTRTNAVTVPGFQHKNEVTPLSLCGLLENDAPDNVIFIHLKAFPRCIHDMDSASVTALMWAVKKERMKILLKMFEYEKYVDNCDWDGYTALHYAVNTGNARICQLLLSRGANVNACGGENNSTPLHLACKQNMIDIVQVLISCNADREAVDADSLIPEDHLPQPYDALKECYKEHALGRSSSISLADAGYSTITGTMTLGEIPSANSCNNMPLK